MEEKYYLPSKTKHSVIFKYALIMGITLVILAIFQPAVGWGALLFTLGLAILFLFIPKWRLYSRPWVILKDKTLYAPICRVDKQGNELIFVKENSFNPFIEIPYKDIAQDNNHPSKIYRNVHDDRMAVYIPEQIINYEKCIRILEERIKEAQKP